MNRSTTTAALAPEAGTVRAGVPAVTLRPRLAILGSPGLAYLRARLCAALIRQGFDVDTFAGPYVSYPQRLADPLSDLHAFEPDVVLLTVDAKHLRIKSWRPRIDPFSRWARQELGAALLQHTVLPILPQVPRANAPDSYSLLKGMENEMRTRAEKYEIELVIPDGQKRGEVYLSWHSPPFRLPKKQQRNPCLVDGLRAGGLLAAMFGISCSCLVVDVEGHPWMTDRDIASFLSDWPQRAQHSVGSAGAPTVPESVLFVDCSPFGLSRRKQ